VSGDLRAALAERLAALKQEQGAVRRLLADLQARERQALASLVRLDRVARILEDELAATGAQHSLGDAGPLAAPSGEVRIR
jgi:hypothetical protein